ncbi:hypothetical protein ACIOD0_10015 [Kitasatospora albolonga]
MDPNTTTPSRARRRTALLGAVLPPPAALPALILLPGLYGAGAALCLLSAGALLTAGMLAPAPRKLLRVCAAVGVLGGLGLIVAEAV